jgi:pimeloyl-ACP methyl ester carboxylesterase
MLNELAVAGRRIEVLRIPAAAPDRPPLVLLHEGLGSVALWRDFPEKLAARTGCEVIAVSRYGYGNSEKLAEKRTVRYMHDEALVALPELLGKLGLADPVLIGHSDGASIAIVYAGDGRWRPRALVLMAPHVFVEDVTVASIAAARDAYRTTDLPRRLGRYHADVDATFWGWNDIWLDPAFRAWNIEQYLPGIACPVLAIQGADDEYGTLAQLDAIERGATHAKVARLVLPDCRHSPHRDQPAATLAAVARFIDEM